MFKKDRILMIMMGCMLYGCSSRSPLRKGTFALYEDDKYVCDIYRLNNYQVEKCNEKFLFAKLKWKSNDSFIMEGIEGQAKGVDTIRFLVRHEKIEKDKYYIISTPLNMNLDYEYKSFLIKKSSKINGIYLDTLVSLNKIRHAR